MKIEYKELTYIFEASPSDILYKPARSRFAKDRMIFAMRAPRHLLRANRGQYEDWLGRRTESLALKVRANSPEVTAIASDLEAMWRWRVCPAWSRGGKTAGVYHLMGSRIMVVSGGIEPGREFLNISWYPRPSTTLRGAPYEIGSNSNAGLSIGSFVPFGVCVPTH